MTITRAIAYRDPIEAFRVFAHDETAALLERMGRTQNGHICTLIAANPSQILSHRSLGQDADFFGRLESVLAQRKIEDSSYFSGGAIGYFGYELTKELELLPAPRIDCAANFPDAYVGIYEAVALFDTDHRQAMVVGAGPHAERHVERLADRLESSSTLPAIELPLVPRRRYLAVPKPWECEMSRAAFEQRVGAAIDYIYAGDIFQTNLSQRFLAKRPASLSDYDLFLRLRARTPAPYSAFFRCNDVSLACASPELFLRGDFRGHVLTQPIKGTRPRGITAVEDKLFADELRNSAKDYAENLMIVDVMRNDLARVCRVGSVRAPRLCELETFSSVHHLVSQVEGDLCDGTTALDLLRASFPGASVTGAPKIRAMEIIHELEPSRRGPYCGCFGRIEFHGAIELGMTIRTLAIYRDTVVAQAGGGIVADSVPAHEYDETLVKAAPLFDTLADA